MKSTPLGVDYLSRVVPPHAAHEPKFKIPLPRSFVPRHIHVEYTFEVSSTSGLGALGS